MELSAVRERIDHPAFATTVGALAGYALILLVVFGVLFVLPWLLLAFL
ncbi:hypothetical protein [Salinarchaeum chitinilyticum]